MVRMEGDAHGCKGMVWMEELGLNVRVWFGCQGMVWINWFGWDGMGLV